MNETSYFGLKSFKLTDFHYPSPTAVTVGPNGPSSVHPGHQNKLPKLCFLSFLPRAPTAKGHGINLVNFLPHCRTVNKGQAADSSSIYHLGRLGADGRVEPWVVSGRPLAGANCQGWSLAELMGPDATEGGPVKCWPVLCSFKILRNDFIGWQPDVFVGICCCSMCYFLDAGGKSKRPH